MPASMPLDLIVRAEAMAEREDLGDRLRRGWAAIATASDLDEACMIGSAFHSMSGDGQIYNAVANAMRDSHLARLSTHYADTVRSA